VRQPRGKVPDGLARLPGEAPRLLDDPKASGDEAALYAKRASEAGRTPLPRWLPNVQAEGMVLSAAPGTALLRALPAGRQARLDVGGRVAPPTARPSRSARCSPRPR